MFNAISAILFFHCKTKGIDCSADCNNRDIYIYIYIYIHFRNMKKDYFHLFALVFLGFYRILFALVAYLQNIKQNVIHLLWSRR